MSKLKDSPGLKQVDNIEVTVLVDNVSDILSTVPESVKTEVNNVFSAGAKELSGSCLCCAQWGLSLLITAYQGKKSHTILFDTGCEGYGIKRNADRLGIDLGIIESVVFSHGHWDHVGGATEVLRMIYSDRHRKTTLYANDGMFVRRGMQSPDNKVVPFEEVPAKKELEAAGGKVISRSEEQTILDEMFYISGEIPRITPYEKGFPGHVKYSDKKWEPEPHIMDERFLAVNVRNKGLIIFTSCSHAGIINVLKCVEKAFHKIPIYGTVGGLHLSGKASEEVIPETVSDMARYGLKSIVAGHCTGWRAVHALVKCFGEEVVIPSAVGRTHFF